MPTNISLSLTPRRPALLQGMPTRLEVLARLTAETVQILCDRDPHAKLPPEFTRPALNLAIVLDRSGSMAGRPIEEAKRLAIRMAESLGPRDRLALVVYDNVVDVLVPSAPGGNAAAFRAALAGIEARGSTDLHGGWKAGARQVAPHATDNRVSRVLLLSDGNQNHGLTDPDRICAEVAAMAEAGVGTSTFGLGSHFNEALMGAMARAGQGGAHYGDTAEDLAEPFAAELALANALVARQVRLALTPGAGCTVEVLGGLPQGPDGVRLPDLADGAAVWALLAVTVPADHRGWVLSARARWRAAEGVTRSEDSAAIMDLPALPPAAFAALPEDADVVARLAEVEAADLQLRARTAAYQGRWDEVERAITQMEARAAASPWLGSVAQELRALAARRDTPRFAKEAFYASHAMTSRQAAAREVAAHYDESAVGDMPAFLRRKARQGKATKE